MPRKHWGNDFRVFFGPGGSMFRVWGMRGFPGGGPGGPGAGPGGGGFPGGGNGTFSGGRGGGPGTVSVA